jgi:hypothetical protein
MQMSKELFKIVSWKVMSSLKCRSVARYTRLRRVGSEAPPRVARGVGPQHLGAHPVPHAPVVDPARTAVLEYHSLRAFRHERWFRHGNRGDDEGEGREGREH